MAVIETTGLTFNYSVNDKAIHDINLKIEQGNIYGFLGPNGSGKTTTLSLLLGILKVQEGSIKVFGKDIQHNRIDILKRTGSLIETPSLYGHLTAKENISIYKPVYGVTTERITEVLKLSGLEDTGRKIVRKFSLGMKQRLSIALALLPNPELLILDEPANGLDPNGIIELRELIKDLNKNYGMTILISSHILSEVEKMVSRIGLISKGRLLFQGSLADLHIFQQNKSRLFINTSDNNHACTLLREHSPEITAESLSFSYKDIMQAATINKLLLANGIDVYLLYPQKNTLHNPRKLSYPSLVPPDIFLTGRPWHH